MKSDEDIIIDSVSKEINKWEDNLVREYLKKSSHDPNESSYDPWKDVRWICRDCAHKEGGKLLGVATFHNGKCDVCKHNAMVTEPRDYGFVHKGYI